MKTFSIDQPMKTSFPLQLFAWTRRISPLSENDEQKCCRRGLSRNGDRQLRGQVRQLDFSASLESRPHLIEQARGPAIWLEGSASMRVNAAHR